MSRWMAAWLAEQAEESAIKARAGGKEGLAREWDFIARVYRAYADRRKST